MIGKRPLNVLFLCTDNAVRSAMAEAILNREGTGRFRAFSAGLQPKSALHPYARDLLVKLNFEVERVCSRSWLEFVGPEAAPLDFVFTVCDETARAGCAGWNGHPLSAHWGVPDPAAAVGNEAQLRLAFADTFRMLSNRIAIFASLPLHALDELSLQRRLNSIACDRETVPSPASTTSIVTAAA
jgi:protein-tyrosine-phosphatase